MRKMNLTRHGLMLAISYLLVAMFFISCTKKDDLKLNDSETNTKSKLKAAVANSSQVIIDDMTLVPDAAMHGVPSSYSWASGAAQPQPMPVPAKNYKGEWFQAMTVWGQAYIPVEGSPATNTRCQIRNLLTKFLKNDGTWITVQSGTPQGAAFVEDFANNASMDAGARDESANGGGVSVIVGVGNWAGHNYHFWPAGRAAVDVNTIVGVFTTCEARLIKSDPNGQDDRNTCKNILQMGADWWLNMQVGWLPDWSANSGIGGGRTKWVTSDWQSFNMCTLLPEAIRANPPISGSSILVTSVSVSPANTSLSVNGTVQLTPTIAPSNATNQNVSWTSSNTSIASVNTTGLVSGLAVGSATITVTTQDGNKTATSSITITGVSGVTIPAKIEAENFNSMSGIQTENCSEGTSNVGWTDIGDWMNYSVNASAGTYTVDLRVASPNSNTQLQIKSGTTVLATVTVPNTGGWQNWQTVSSGSFNLPAGVQTIQVYVSGGGWNINWLEFKSGGTAVAVTGVSVSPTSASVAVGATNQLTATVAPSNATNKNVTWSSSNTSFATVSPSGLVSGVAAGTSTITVTTLDGLKTATCSVSVTTVTNTNLALNKSYALGSANYSSIGSAFDGNISTGVGASQNYGGNGILAADLSYNANITSIRVSFGDVSAYQVQVSGDGTTWINIGSKVTSPTNPNTTTYTGVTYRYVRCVFDAFFVGGAGWWNPGIKEIEVYGN